MVQLPCVWLDFDGASTLKVVPSTFFPRVNSEHDPLQNGIMLSSVGELGIMFDCFALAREVLQAAPRSPRHGQRPQEKAVIFRSPTRMVRLCMPSSKRWDAKSPLFHSSQLRSSVRCLRTPSWWTLQRPRAWPLESAMPGKGTAAIRGEI